MDFTGAYILGVQRRSEYLGENTALYRTIDTLSLEGYIDVRSGAAHDPFGDPYEGVRQAVDIIDQYVAAASGSLNNTAAWNHNLLDEITINGSGFGTGRLVSLDFPASDSFDENQVLIGKYTADVEIYNSGDLKTTFEGANIPNLQFLNELSEDFNISLDEQGVYTLQHNINVTYLSGITGSGALGEPKTLNPISGAKNLADTLFNQVPTQFSTVLGDSYGSISAPSRKYYNETYNLTDGSCSFGQQLKLFPEGFSTYSLSVTNNFEMDTNGIISVTENGEISPRSMDFLEEAKAAVETEISKSYSRCNNIYTNYKNYVDTNSSSLHSKPISITKNINNSAATCDYSVNYTDNANFRNLAYVTNRTITFSKNDNIIEVSEDGDLISTDGKSTTFNAYNFIPSRASAKNRCQAVYSQNKGAGTLKNKSNKFVTPAYGKQVSYSYAFTDDPTLFDVAGGGAGTTSSDNKVRLSWPLPDSLAGVKAVGWKDPSWDGDASHMGYAGHLGTDVGYNITGTCGWAGNDWNAMVNNPVPVYAAADGTIERVEFGYKDQCDSRLSSGPHAAGGSKCDGYNNYVVIDHGTTNMGYRYTSYLHLQENNVANLSPGDSISRGALIGYVGSAGNSTNPHIHFEAGTSAGAGDSIGGVVDPFYSASAMGSNTTESLWEDQCGLSILGFDWIGVMCTTAGQDYGCPLSQFGAGVNPVNYFAKKQISHSDKIGVPVQSAITLPNIPNELLHTPGQTQLGTRSSKFEAVIRRPKYINNVNSPSIPAGAITTAKSDLLSDAYKVFIDNNLIRSKDKNQIYISNASYSFDSENNFNMSVDSTFTLERIAGQENNLLFAGTPAAGGGSIASDAEVQAFADSFAGGGRIITGIALTTYPQASPYVVGTAGSGYDSSDIPIITFPSSYGVGATGKGIISDVPSGIIPWSHPVTGNKIMIEFEMVSVGSGYEPDKETIVPVITHSPGAHLPAVEAQIYPLYGF